MGTSSKTTVIIAVAAVIAFIFGLAHLFVLRFEAGDVFAPYSSFRSDPIGVRALYEAMGRLDGVSVQRNLEPLSELPDGRGKTLVICGATTSKDPEKTLERLERFAAEGGRIVITFLPKTYSPKLPEKKKKDKKKDTKKPEEKEKGCSGEDGCEVSEEGKERKKTPWYAKLVSIEDRWGFSFETSEIPKSKSGAAETRAYLLSGSETLPSAMSWHSAMFFKNPNEAWKKVYARDKLTVVMERPWLKGSIALFGDSYFMSNEAMRNERYPGLLAWLVGSSSTVIFDEIHLGTQDKPGVMTLARRYRLEGVLAVIGLVAGLFIWKNTSSLIPRRDTVAIERELSAEGKDSAAALVNVLRRSVPSKSILSICAREWDKSVKVKGDRQARVQAVVDREEGLPHRERDAVAAYRTICGILKERNW